MGIHELKIIYIYKVLNGVNYSKDKKKKSKDRSEDWFPFFFLLVRVCVLFTNRIETSISSIAHDQSMVGSKL